MYLQWVKKNSKIYTKIEGVTSNKRDIILLSDCRLGSKGMDVERLFRLSRNGSYKLYWNSKRDSRGVAIAIRSDVFHTVNDIIRDDDDNYIFLKLRIRDRNLLLGCIYGPNRNDEDFFLKIKEICGNSRCDFIIGGISIQYWMTGMGKIHWIGWGMDTVRIQGTQKY